MTPTYFLRLSKVWSILHHGSVGRIHNKVFFNPFIYFLDIFLLCFIIKFMFLSFSFFFWWSIKFPQQNINQSETRIGGFQLAGKLCANRQAYVVTWLNGLNYTMKLLTGTNAVFFRVPTRNRCCYSKPGSGQCTTRVTKIFSQLFQVWRIYSECLLGIVVAIPNRGWVNALLALLHLYFDFAMHHESLYCPFKKSKLNS